MELIPQHLMEQTLVLIKPDGVARNIIGEVITRFERAGLMVVALRMVRADQETVAQHYIEDPQWMESIGAKARASAEKHGQEFSRTNMEHGQMVRGQLMDYLAIGPVVAMVLEGHNAVALVRKITGSTEPATSAPGTIRGDF